MAPWFLSEGHLAIAVAGQNVNWYAATYLGVAFQDGNRSRATAPDGEITCRVAGSDGRADMPGRDRLRETVGSVHSVSFITLSVEWIKNSTHTAGKQLPYKGTADSGTLHGHWW